MIEDKKIKNIRNQVLMEGIRFCWKQSGFGGRNKVLMVEL
jgi:hypothetical protein